MARPKVFVTRRLPAPGLDRMRDIADVEVWQDELPPPENILLEKVPGVHGLVCLLTDRIDARVFEAGRERLQVVSQFAVGVDNIDLNRATSLGIPIGHTPGALTDATADFTWALLMAAARRVVEGDHFVRSGRWRTWGPELLLGPDVAGATLGIVGLGRIGEAVAQRAVGFGMELLYTDHNRRLDLERRLAIQPVELDQLLDQSDFVSLHAPLNQETYHLIGPEQLRRMKPSAVLINCARGAMVDPDALVAALKKGEIAFAALDVTDPEPLPLDSPLLQLDNIVLAPHMASASITARSRMAIMAAENLAAGLRGDRLPYCANPQVYATHASA